MTVRNGYSKHRLYGEDYGVPAGWWDHLSPELQSRMTLDATERANKTIGNFKKFVQYAVDNGAITLPDGKSIDDLFYYKFDDIGPTVVALLNPTYYMPALFLHKNRKGGTIKNPKYYK